MLHPPWHICHASREQSRAPGPICVTAPLRHSFAMDRPRSRSRDRQPDRFYPAYDGQTPENVEMDLRMYREIVRISNPEYEVIQNPLLITQVMQPLSDILGVPVPTFDILSEMFEKVDARCGGCCASDGCDPYFLVALMRAYAAQ